MAHKRTRPIRGALALGNRNHCRRQGGTKSYGENRIKAAWEATCSGLESAGSKVAEGNLSINPQQGVRINNPNRVI